MALFQNIKGVGTGLSNRSDRRNIVANNTFDSDLTSWNITNGGGQTIEWQAPGVVHIVSDGTAAAVWQSVLEIGGVYNYCVDVAITSGTCKILFGSGGSSSVFSSSGRYSGVMTNTGSDGVLFLSREGACDVTFDNVFVYRQS